MPVDTVESAYHFARLLIESGRLVEAADVLPGALDGRPDRASEFGLLLYELAQSGVDEALPLLQHVAGQAPGDIVLQCRLGELLVDFGDAAAAAHHVARAAEMEPAVDDPWQWLYKAIALVRLRRVDEAEAILLRLLERDPCHVEATYHLVQLLIAQDRLNEAVSKLKAVIEPGRNEAASQRRGEFSDLVFQLAEKGESGSVPLLRTIVEQAQSDIVATYRMGEALEFFGDPTAAQAYFERAALTIPSGPNPWQPLYRAIALVRTGRLLEAETVLKALLLVDTNPIETVYHLCHLLMRQNRLPEAAAVLAAEVDSIHRRRGAHRVKDFAFLAVELVELGVREAMAVLERLADLAPDDVVVRYRLATAIALHAPSEAMTHFQRVAAAEPGPDADSGLCQALALVRLNRIDNAEAALRQLLVLNPANHDAVCYLSGLYFDHGRPAEALSLLASFVGTERGPASRRGEFSYELHRLAQAGFKEAVPLLRDLADRPLADIASQYRLADALSVFGDALEATRFFKRAADATPAAADVWGRLYKAQALERLGRADEAEAALRSALTLDSPPIEIASRLIQLLIGRNRLPEAAAVLATEVESSMRTRRGAHRVKDFAFLAVELVELGVREAMAVLERLADLAPDDVVVRYRLATAIALHAPSEAMTHFQRVAAAEPGPDADSGLYQALALVRLNRIDNAEAALRQLLVLNPANHDAVCYLSGLYFDHGRPAEALSLLASFVGTERGPASRRGEFSYELHRLAQAGFKEAVPLLRDLADRPLADIASQYRLADALSVFGDALEATRFFKRAADATPAAADVWGRLYKAQALERLGRADEAEAALRSALTLDSPPIEIASRLIQLLIGRNRLPEAAAVLATEVESSMRTRRGAHRVTDFTFLAVQLVELGVREAMAVLERLADLAPDDVVVRYRLATAIALHAPSEAMSHFQRAAAADPGLDAAPRLCQALALVRLRRIDDAESALRQLLTLDPGNHDAVIYLSELYLEHGLPAEALSLLASFVGTERGPASRRGEFSNGLHRLALAGFKEAVPLLRDLADLPLADIASQYRLADALSVFGDALEATRFFKRAADATPAAADVWGRLFKAQALERLGRAGEAEAVLRSALTLDSPNISIAYNLIDLLIKAQRFAEAADLLKATIATPRPGTGNLMVLASVLAARGVESADVLVQRILELNATDEPALKLFAQIAFQYSRPHEAADYIARAQAISDTDAAARRIDRALMLPFVLSSDEDIPYWVDRFTRGADALISSGIKVENPLSAIANPPYFQFFTFGTNTRDLYRKAASVWKAAHPALNWTAPHCLSWRGQRLNRKLRIGFYTQPTFPLVWGIARALDRSEFEVVHLHERCFPLTPQSPWLGAADRHVAVPNTSIEDARRVIAEQELDILVHMPYTNLRYFVSHARLAPVQCVLCEPCYTDGLDNLDYYISWDSAEPVPLDDWYSCAVALMRSAPYWVQHDYSRLDDLPRSEFPLPPEARWYLCPSTPVKMQPRFDRLIARILEEDPEGVFVLLRGDIPMGRFALERIRRAVGAAADRVHALPTLPEKHAHALLGLADCVLDSWPMGGMSSSFAAIYAGVPTVTMPENIPFGRWQTTMYEAIGVTDLIASTPDDYVRLAVRLANDPSWKAGLADRIKARRDVFVENHAAVREIESFLRAAVSAAHRGDDPRHWRNGYFR